MSDGHIKEIRTMMLPRPRTSSLPSPSILPPPHSVRLHPLPLPPLPQARSPSPPPPELGGLTTRTWTRSRCVALLLPSAKGRQRPHGPRFASASSTMFRPNRTRSDIFDMIMFMSSAPLLVRIWTNVFRTGASGCGEFEHLGFGRYRMRSSRGPSGEEESRRGRS